MAKRVKEISSPDETETFSPDETEERNLQQPENSRFERVRKSGEKMVELSSYQPKEGSRKRKVEINTNNNDQKIYWGQIFTRPRQYVNEHQELLKENKRLKSEITCMEEEEKRLESQISALKQQIEIQKNFLERMSMAKDSPMDIDSPMDPMEIDLSEGKIDDALIQVSQTELSEFDMSDIYQILDKLEKILDINKKLERDNERLSSKLTALDENVNTLRAELTALAETLNTLNARLCSELTALETLNKSDNKMPSACHSEELATNKHGKGATGRALESKSEDEQTEAPKGKLPIAVDDAPTCLPTSSTSSSDFTCNTCHPFTTTLVPLFHLLHTAGSAESREATQDNQASTYASGIKGTIDVQAFLVSYSAQERASARAQRESRAVNAEEEDGPNQATETADDDD